MAVGIGEIRDTREKGSSELVVVEEFLDKTWSFQNEAENSPKWVKTWVLIKPKYQINEPGMSQKLKNKS